MNFPESTRVCSIPRVSPDALLAFKADGHCLRGRPRQTVFADHGVPLLYGPGYYFLTYRSYVP